MSGPQGPQEALRRPSGASKSSWSSLGPHEALEGLMGPLRLSPAGSDEALKNLMGPLRALWNLWGHYEAFRCLYRPHKALKGLYKAWKGLINPLRALQGPQGPYKRCQPEQPNDHAAHKVFITLSKTPTHEQPEQNSGHNTHKRLSCARPYRPCKVLITGFNIRIASWIARELNKSQKKGQDDQHVAPPRSFSFLGPPRLRSGSS